jgi:CheY-like chemotaxis protein
VSGSMAGRVMVVEDDPDIREAVRVFLASEGWDVVEAANGRDALALLRSASLPNVILLDLRMPIMDGRRFVAELSRDDALASLPVFVLSAYEERDAELHDLKVRGFLPKPIRFDRLANTVAAFRPSS